MLGRFVRVALEEFPDFLFPLYWWELWNRKRIDRVCRGYSGRRHWRFWKTVLRRQNPADMCVLGVYFGRDLAYLSWLSRHMATRFTGIDKFEDSPCEDWPEELQGKTWQSAGFGPTPTPEIVYANLRRLDLDTARVSLKAERAVDFLTNTQQMFDFIYIDISHDYQSTVDTIRAAMPRLRPGGLLGGDDYSDEGTWGVKSAVHGCFERHEVFDKHIWTARPEHYKGG